MGQGTLDFHSAFSKFASDICVVHNRSLLMCISNNEMKILWEVTYSGNTVLSRKTCTNIFLFLKSVKRSSICLLHEMLLIRELTPSLSVQSDSIRTKLFA